MRLHRAQAERLTSPPPLVSPTPLFIEGGAGPIFAIYHAPHGGTAHRGDVVYVPPFAEEMNRSRRMAALQARALADTGFGVLLLDLYGCGDSTGDFAAARWEIWQQDLAAALDWLEDRGARSVGLWGLRLGAVLALEAAGARRHGVSRVVLWQPVTNGQMMLTQFLRVRIAANLTTGQASGETTKDLRQRLTTGEAIEVAGYELAPELAAAVDAQRLGPLGPLCQVPVHWIELVPEPDRTPPPASQAVIDEWRQAGVDLTVETVVGDPFWTLQETTLAPNLLEPTQRVFAGAGA